MKDQQHRPPTTPPNSDEQYGDGWSNGNTLQQKKSKKEHPEAVIPKHSKGSITGGMPDGGWLD